MGAAAFGCKRADDRAPRPTLSQPPRPARPSAAVLLEPSGVGRIRYLGADWSPAQPERGQVVELTHYFQVEAAPRGDFDVFLHGEVPGTGERVLVGDHAPIDGRFQTSRWRRGEIWADRHRVTVPKDSSAVGLELYVGLFKGDVRWTAEVPPGGADGQDRVRLGLLPLAGATPEDDLPVALVASATGAIRPDGVLDEPAWARAAVLSFADSMGRGGTPRFPTKLRLLWDKDALYAAFESVDADITERYSKRDDPIYEHETVELFLMPNVVAPALGPYLELQASPTGVIFDAAFTARRQGMDTRFDAAQVVGTKLDGTLNKSDDQDRGWVSEWAVPWTSLRGVSGPPAPGAEWRMNAFRIEKFGAEGEYTAWSPPRVGDFHNVARFGRMRFSGGAP